MESRRHLLYRLYSTKLALLATICISLGIILLILAQVDAIERLSLVPVKDLGSAFFTSGLIAVAIEYLDTRDAEQRIRQSVISGFAPTPETLTTVASPQTLDHIIRNCLTVQLGNAELATDIYSDLRAQVLASNERRYDTHVSTTLTPWEDGPPTGTGAMFVATIRTEFHATGITGEHRFICVSDERQYRESMREPETAEAWFLDPKSGLRADAAEVFQLLDYTINGIPQPIQQTVSPTSQIYSVAIPADEQKLTAQDCHISYTYQVLVPKHGHLVYLDINKPSKKLRITFTHHNCDIRYVNTLDLLASAQNPRVQHSPSAAPTSTVDISFDGWIFPKSGIAFTWTLTNELAAMEPSRDGSKP